MWDFYLLLIFVSQYLVRMGQHDLVIKIKFEVLTYYITIFKTMTTLAIS